jgi:alpha-galactosidase
MLAASSPHKDRHAHGFVHSPGLSTDPTRQCLVPSRPMMSLDTAKVQGSSWRVVSPTDGASLQVVRRWNDGICAATVTNVGSTAAIVDEVVVISVTHDLAADTPLYGEGFQMLSQYGGTISKRRLIGEYEDAGHYRLPEPPGWTTVYNLALLSPPGSDACLFAFTTCNRYNGQVRIGGETIEAVMLTEGLELAPGASWQLEALSYSVGDPETLLRSAGAVIARTYGEPTKGAPRGWCSWYWYWENVTERDVMLNARTILDRRLPLRYVQIDDGYQSAMGDWLVPKEPESPPKDLCAALSAQGLEPAIWVAPFIAQRDSLLVATHPEWFVAGADGTPLSSDEVTYGGWRNGPWLMLDLTNTDALEYLSRTFSTMRHDWGCRYFKLDATVWGAFPWGARADRASTTVEAYRNAMAVIRAAVGPESIIVGCNAPMWPSLGLVDVMRVTGDVARRWPTLRSIIEEGMCRQWQNGLLWVNDPDCLVMRNQSGDSITDGEYSLLCAYVMAVGGSVFCGDELMSYTDAELDVLRMLVAGAVTNTQFSADRRFAVGTSAGGHQVAFLFNWGDEPCLVQLSGPAAADYWSGEPVLDGGALTLEVGPRTARVLEATAGAMCSFERLHDGQHC